MIPRRLHLVWIGGPMPAQIAANVAAWRKLHPRPWAVRVWGNESFAHFADAWLNRMRSDPAADCALIVDRLRFLILEQCGGFYVDVDARPLRRLDELLEVEACGIAGLHPRDCRRDRICDASALAAVAHLPAFGRLLGWWYGEQRPYPRGGAMGEFLRTIEPRLEVWPWQFFCAFRPVAGAYALHWPHRLASWHRPSAD